MTYERYGEAPMAMLRRCPFCRVDSLEVKPEQGREECRICGRTRPWPKR